MPCDAAIPLPVMYSKEKRTLTQKDPCTPLATAALFTIAISSKIYGNKFFLLLKKAGQNHP